MSDETIAAPPPVAVGSLIDSVYELKERLRELEAEKKELNAQLATLEADLLATLDAQGVTLCRGRRASASISESVVPNAADWEEIYEYIRNEDALYLMERRLAVRAWRELYEGGTLIPGTEPFTKRSINTRKL